MEKTIVIAICALFAVLLVVLIFYGIGNSAKDYGPKRFVPDSEAHRKAQQSRPDDGLNRRARRHKKD